MRVLHLTRDFPPTSAGGISTGVGWLARSMRAEGWPQAVASFDGWRPRKQNDRVEDRGDVLRIQGRPFGALRAFAERFGPDLCVVHDPLIDRAVGPLPGRRLFFVHVDHRRLRELRGLEEPTTSERAMERAMAEADAVLAPSQALVDRLARRGQGARRARLGVDPPPTGPVPQGDDVLHLGRLDRAKGTDLLLSALDGLPAPLLAGGLPHNPRAEARWREAWPEARWHGWLEPDERDALMRRAGLLAVPSLEETLGLVALEAQRLGLPVVASDVGGLGEVLRDTGGGRLVPAGDGAALREAIVELSGDPDLRRALGERGREAIAERWVWPALRGEWSAALEAPYGNSSVLVQPVGPAT